MHTIRLFLLLICVSVFTKSFGQPAKSVGKDTLRLTVKGVSPGSQVSLSAHGRSLDTLSDKVELTGNGLVLDIKTNNKPVHIIWQRNSPAPMKREDFNITKDTVIQFAPEATSAETSSPVKVTVMIFNTTRPAQTLKTFRQLSLTTTKVVDKTPNVADPGKPADTAKHTKEPEDTVALDKSKTGKQPFVDNEMMASVSSESTCRSCKLSDTIVSRSNRKFTTDYFILYDRSPKTDAFTICKHIFRKSGGKIQERYRRVRPAFFSPMVGSNVSFEVVNFSLLESLSIVVDTGDLFLNSSGFQSVLTARLNATILNIPASTSATQTKPGKKSDSLTAGNQGLQQEDSAAKLQRLYGELATYVRTFSGSSCTINQHRINSILILNRIQEQFDLPGPMGLVTAQLTAKFNGTPEQQLAKDAGVLLAALDSLKPLLYVTPRMPNRDYLNIKVKGANNQEIVSQNIRTSFGMKIDFSTGLFLTGLRDHSYIFKDTTLPYKRDDESMADTSGRIIIREKGDRLNLGFGFLAHAYPRLSSNYNIGIATGFMATTNLDLNILLGGSLMFQSLFGANTRIAFTGGIAWGKVSRLSNAVYEGIHTVNGKPVYYPSSVNTPSVVKVWDKSWFFGMTYNF